jgi:putative oxidoreductase
MTSIARKLLSASRWSHDSTDWVSLLIRVTICALMTIHGYSKFQILTSGNPIDFPDPIGLGPTTSLILVVTAEFICSILVVVGLFTRYALLVLIGNMLVISFIVHGKDSLEDKEHALMYLFTYIALFLLGSGRFSLDYWIRGK